MRRAAAARDAVSAIADGSSKVFAPAGGTQSAGSMRWRGTRSPSSAAPPPAQASRQLARQCPHEHEHARPFERHRTWRAVGVPTRGEPGVRRQRRRQRDWIRPGRAGMRRRTARHVPRAAARARRQALQRAAQLLRAVSRARRGERSSAGLVRPPWRRRATRRHLFPVTTISRARARVCALCTTSNISRHRHQHSFGRVGSHARARDAHSARRRAPRARPRPRH